MITKFSKEHIESVCDLHMKCFRGDFLPSMGRDFLRIIYKGILETETGFGFVFIDNGLKGFVLGTLNSKEMLKKVIYKKFIKLSFYAIKKIIHEPTLIKKIIETFLYPDLGYNAAVNAELVSIAVEGKHRRKGIGKALNKALNEEFLRMGYTRYKVLVSREGANIFYEKLKFLFINSKEMYDKTWTIYSKI